MTQMERLKGITEALSTLVERAQTGPVPPSLVVQLAIEIVGLTAKRARKRRQPRPPDEMQDA